MFGMSPKRFARVARIESAWSARSQGASWVEAAYATGFTDQAHMINDFVEIIGVPPAQLVSPPAIEQPSAADTPSDAAFVAYHKHRIDPAR